MIEKITIKGGYDKQGNQEPLKEVIIKKGEIFGVVGPTGSGKSSLIGDIEQLAQEDTFSKRKILVNDKEPSYEDRTDPRKKMVAQLSQNMNFLADMSVGDFLSLHAKCRGASNTCVDKVVKLANTLTGEPIKKEHELTILSGGQSRALMVADVAIISNSPIVLIDEIENAGIRKHDALKVLAGHGKIVLVVTHDPVLALMTDKRIVMRNGGMEKVVGTTPSEKEISRKLNKIDELMLSLREKVRNGEVIEDIEDIEF
ncbi:ABC transporter ATP-binding protein [Methanobacterium sp. CWC-01]|jgi:ABC-type lipoprotein export system ATPase subunit|uniref:ATP-binding cassette domain-containing protein n=1 Tax=Methanobacterium aridiramus TaxID=2584467 RepID=UPI002577ECA2|nr:ATP-binding cassette domain-containing protein [Methanobacterium sp. CWC-01]WJI09096.1 ABC transporter ATP-binding protein [Methanobacterium sp. CWC-01]